MKIDEDILRKAGVRLLVVFGSRAEGRSRAGSDLDIGISLAGRPPYDLLKTVGLVQRVVQEPGADVDIVDLDRADPLVLFEIAVHGRPVFEADPGAFEEFRIRAVKRYYDTAWIRRRERAALRRRFG